MSEPPPTRKPYRITKQREKWSEEEHRRFTEAIEKYGRDWRRIVDHIQTRTVAQVRSHAQKFFLKLEKTGRANVVPPPRPKKRAAKPYPVQDRSEERRKSKRARPSSSNSSGQSVPSHTSPSGTPASGYGRSSARSAGTAVTSLLTSSSRPLRSTRLTRAVLSSGKGSSQELLEGNGSNINSAHESNNELSGDPSAITQENSGQSTSEFDVPDPNSFSQEPEALPRPQVQDRASPAPDYGQLYQVVGSLFDSCGATNDEKNQKQMIEQLEPTQRQSLLQMMNKLSGSLQSTCSTAEQLKMQLRQQHLDDSGKHMLDVAMPNTPPVFPHPMLHSQLDHAASMPLMPSTASLPMPQSLTDEPLPTLQPLPGSQGTALLQPLYPACLSQPCAASAPSDDSNPLQSAADALISGGSVGVSATAAPGASDNSSQPPPLLQRQPSGNALQASEADANAIAEQLLNSEPHAPSVEEQLFSAQPVLELPHVHPHLDLPKQDDLHRTPLDDCLAQLEDETAPNMPELPETEDFFDNWKIGITDPVWRTLEMKEPSNMLSASTMSSGMLQCPPT